MDAIFGKIGRWPIGGIAISLMAVLAHWGRNPFRLGVESAWPTLLAVGLIALAVTGLMRLMSYSWARAGIAASFVAIYAFYVPVLLNLMPMPYAARLLLHLACVGTLLLFWLRLPTDPARFLEVAGRLNLVLFALLVATIVPIIAQQFELERHRAAARSSLRDLDGKAAASSPDVWHIIFDRYADNRTLRRRYDYDNSPFVDALRQRGFVVQDTAYSNYQRTGHSVASTMNGQLLDPMSEPMASEPGDWVPIYRALRNGAAIRLFDKFGYKTVFAGSWWEPTRFSDVASQSIKIRAMPQLARVALDRSAFGFWFRGVNVPWLDARNDQCYRANEKFKRLRELANDQSRKYVFAHFLIPHPPFVLKADGTCRSLQDAVRTSRRDNYVAQIEFANRNVLALIDVIVRSKRPAIIVIHSDEGPWPAPYIGNEHTLGKDPVRVPWAKLSQDQMEEKMGILLAARDPSGQPPQTVPTSPVQIYPAILKDHFGSRQPLPRSEHFVFTSNDNLYDFSNVGSRLSGAQAQSNGIEDGAAATGAK